MDEYIEQNPANLIADALSLITISLCFIMKLPQIQKVKKSRQAQGISLLSLALELFSYTVMMSYNYLNEYKVLSYLEYPVLLLQEIILIYFVLKYKNMLKPEIKFAAVGYGIFAVAVYFRMIPYTVCGAFVPLCTPIGASSKIIQLLAMLKSRDSSSVSPTTWAISAFTNLTRIYTIYMDSKDLMLLFNFIISFTLSFIVCVTAIVLEKPKTI